MMTTIQYYPYYRGAFLQKHSGATFEVELLRGGATHPSSPGMLTFDATPLTIEWEECDVHGVVQGSLATLRVVSDDRTFYTAIASSEATWLMRVYRDGALYWTGVVDRELGSEPYDAFSGYVVTLTATDFGILDRKDFDLHGVVTYADIIDAALSKASLFASHVLNAVWETLPIEEFLSPMFPGEVRQASLANLAIAAENFYDEEGQPSSWRDAVEAILKPLGYRMVQRGGHLHIYDINALVSRGRGDLVDWSATGQSLGIGAMYNKAVITFSPYAQQELLPEMTYGGVTSRTLLPRYEDQDPSVFSEGAGGAGFSVTPDLADRWVSPDGTLIDHGAVSFNMFLGGGLDGSIAALGSHVKSGKIVPVYGGGSETACAVTLLDAGQWTRAALGLPDDGSAGGSVTGSALPPTGAASKTMAMRLKRIYLPPVDDATAANYLLRFTLPLLADVRYNPFTSEGDNNEASSVSKMEDKRHSTWVFVPTRLTLWTSEEGGSRTLIYSNDNVARGGVLGEMQATGGAWLPYADNTLKQCWLEYYDGADPYAFKIGGGWKRNRQCVGRPDNLDVRDSSTMGTSFVDRGLNNYSPYGGVAYYFYDNFVKMDDGEYIPYPAQGGWLEIEVLNGIAGHRGSEDNDIFRTLEQDFWHFGNENNRPVAQRLRWLAYGVPELGLVSAATPYDDVEQGDIEITGDLQASAIEKLEIATICGSANGCCPACRGLILDATTHKPIDTLRIGDVTASVERLLLARLFSNLAAPRALISGEVSRLGNPGATEPCRYIDAAQGGRYFLMIRDHEDCLEGVADATFVEANTDNYRPL